MSPRPVGLTVLRTLFVLGVAANVHAQASAPNDVGFQPNRDYLALQPWEAIDTSNNNVILTFTDLVLPGNAKRELRFERVFTNVVDSAERPVGPQWRFGIGGVPMRVIERPYITTPISPPGNIERERNTTPYFWMLDGSRLKTTYVLPPDPASSSTLVNVRTHHFWFYHRPSRTLSIPDGTIAEYNSDGRLTTIRDVFDGSGTNVVTLEWLTDGQQNLTGLEVTQSLGNGQSRVVFIQFDPGTGLPARMSYDGRTWTYRYNTRGLLEGVDLPLGAGARGWQFEYSTEPFSADKVTRATTPQGGAVAYEYADREFQVGGTRAIFNVLDVRRTYDHDARLFGEWKFTHFANAAGGNDVTEVTLPSQAKVTYEYGTYPDSNALAGTSQLRFRTVHSPAGSPIEREERRYTALLRAARSEEPWGVPQLARRLVTRAGQTYTTVYAYSGNTLPSFHEFHNPITITERGPGGTVERTRRLTYRHLIGDAYILGLPATESITVGGKAISKSWGYNASTGFPQSETINGITTTFGADAFGNVATALRANGKSTSFTYSWGTLENTTTPGVAIERAINSDGTVASETVAARTTTYEYNDPLGRRTRIQPPGSTNPTTVTYDDASRTVTTRRGVTTLTTVNDGFGRPIETINGAGVRTRMEYDAEGRRTYQSYPFSSTDVGTEFSYDAFGRVTAEINSDGTRRTRSYDDTTNSVTILDEENRVTLFVHRAFGHPDDVRLVKVVDADQQEWTYSYDAIGNLARVVTPTGHTRTWVRSTSGLLTSEMHPESGTVRYTRYDAAGVLKRKVDAKGTELVYQHDGNDRVTRITAGSRVTAIAYELGSDNRVSVNNGFTSTAFDYDTAGRLAHRRDVIGEHVFDSHYGYDGNDQITSITYPSGRVISYERADAEGRPTRVFETAAGRDYAYGMTYHPSGALTRYTAGNTISTAIQYDSARYWIRSIDAGALRLTYGPYDGAGNVLALQDSRPGMGQTFTYDPLHRLSTASGPYGSTAYAYDAHGNRRGDGGSTYTYDAATLRLTGQNGVPFGYDANGNLTTSAGATYTYTPENWLATSVNSGNLSTYLYDGDGWRVQKSTTGDTTFYLRGSSSELLTEWHDLGSSARARDYVYAGTRLLAAVDRPVSLASTCGGQPIPDSAPASLTVPAGGTATFTFEGIACRRASASITASTLDNCLLIYHKLQILNPDGSILASFNGACAGDIVGPVTLPTSGTYTVVVYAYAPYHGTVTVKVHDVVDVTGAITFGQVVNARIDTPGQRGQWTFTATAGRHVSAVVHTSDFSSCNIYHSFVMLKPDGSTLGSGSWNICAGSIIGPFLVPTTGTYALVVDPHRSATGQFAVSVYDVVDVTGAIALDGSPVTAALNTPGQRALWTFTGTANQKVSTVVSTSTVSSCSLYNSFGILKPDGTALQTQWNMCAGAIVGPVTLPTSGTYTVLVDLAGSSTGQATVKAYNVVDVTGTVTVNGPAVAAPLTVPGQRGLWTFNGTAGQRVRALMIASTVSSCSLYNTFGFLKPDGSALGTQWNMCEGAVTAIVTLPSSGIYSLVVDPAGSQTGTVAARVIDPDIPPVILVNGTSPPTRLTVAPSTVVSVQVTGGPWNAMDWVALAVVGSANTSYLTYEYPSMSGVSMSFTMPSTPGDYEFRLFATNGYTRIATSSTVTVQR